MIWASCEFDGTYLNFLPVLNPGACRGKTFLIEFDEPLPIFVIVESESVTGAIEVLSDDPEFGHGGQYSIAQPVMVHGQVCCDVPFPVRYHDEGYPAEGIDPRQFAAARFN
jgi:hypothetical protein